MGEEAQAIGDSSDSQARDEEEAQNAWLSSPAPSPDGVSRAEAEKTEALKRSILALMQTHRTAFLWAADKAVGRPQPEADC